MYSFGVKSQAQLDTCHPKLQEILNEAIKRWDDTERFAHLVGIIKGIAIAKGINVRLGIDWDNDGDIRDHSFMDYPHIELVQ